MREIDNFSLPAGARPATFCFDSSSDIFNFAFQSLRDF
jgi:hypothetical protein